METSKSSFSLTAGFMFSDGASGGCEAVVGCPGDGGALMVLALGSIMSLGSS